MRASYSSVAACDFFIFCYRSLYTIVNLTYGLEVCRAGWQAVRPFGPKLVDQVSRDSRDKNKGQGEAQQSKHIDSPLIFISNQYSSGSRTQVELRSASVIIQIFWPPLIW
jgi:hypothetical protein